MLLVLVGAALPWRAWKSSNPDNSVLRRPIWLGNLQLTLSANGALLLHDRLESERQSLLLHGKEGLDSRFRAPSLTTLQAIPVAAPAAALWFVSFLASF